MIRQLIYPTKELPPTLQCQILSFLLMTWPEGFIDEKQTQEWLSHQENHPLHLVLVDNGLLISHAEVVWKYLLHGRQLYKAYGLAGVFTCPAFRHQGYGRRIVNAATTYIEHSDADIALLWCAPYLKDLYAQRGWTGMTNARTLIGPKEAPVVYHLLLMMLFLSPQGKNGRPLFESEPIYFGLTPW